MEIYFVEHVKKAKDQAAVVDDFLQKICIYAMDHGDQGRCQGVFERISGHTNNKQWPVADRLAVSYQSAGLHSKAYKFFMKSRNTEQVVSSMRLVMQTGYASEQDLFVARACLDMLIKSTELEKTRAIFNAFRGQTPPSPLLNFVEFLMEAIECEEFQLVKQMANQDYAIELKRDGTLHEKVNTICEKHFGETIKAPNQMQAMLSNLMGGGAKGANPLAALM